MDSLKPFLVEMGSNPATVGSSLQRRQGKPEAMALVVKGKPTKMAKKAVATDSQGGSMGPDPGTA